MHPNLFWKIPFISCWALVLSAGCLPADDNAPRAAYPGGFTRPPSEGKEYDTWADAKGPDVGVSQRDPKRLPSRVDNSSRREYPPIYKQRWGACGQFASVASIFTYEMNVLNGTAADTDAHRFPAHFSWNMMNRAENKGSEAYHGWEVAKRIGIPTAQSYGGVRLNKIGVWPDGYSIWREAMEYRVSGYRYSPANSVAQLNEARGWLYDRNRDSKDGEVCGGIFALDGRMGELKKVTFTIPEGQYGAGKDLWTRWGPSGYGHGITCVGYDDQIGYDVNGDGRITNDLDLNGDGRVTLADWEKGAYIVVNSWGAKWSGDGKIYLLYSAMIDPTWKRGNYLGRAEVKRYIPRHTLRVKMSCSDRTNLRMSIGVSGVEAATSPEYEIGPEAFNGWPLFGRANAGHVPLAGPGEEGPIEVGIDISELVGKLKPEERKTGEEQGRVFVRLAGKEGSSAEGVIHECALRSYDEQGQFLKESKLEVEDGLFGKDALQLSGPLNH